MSRFFKIAPLFALVFSSAVTVNAEVIQPKYTPGEPSKVESTTWEKPSVITKEVSITEAKDLIKSMPSWKVSKVTAPTCTDKKNKRECSKQKAECKEAESFAKKNSAHATCSALYTETKVLLTAEFSAVTK